MSSCLKSQHFVEISTSTDEEEKYAAQSQGRTDTQLTIRNEYGSLPQDEGEDMPRKQTKKDNSGNTSCTTERMIKFLFLALGVVSKGAGILDAVTDIILLTKASQNEAVAFTMILFVTLLAPFILSYSSGIQLFLYRKTFSNINVLSFKGFLLLMYLFPSGIFYFILTDVADALLQIYKFLSFSIACKSNDDLIRMESSVAEYFNMSRMDWISLKKQKVIAQLFFETVPQVSLQALLFFNLIPGKSLTGITDSDLILSISSAVVNCVLQSFQLYAESVAVRESIHQYALHCITARFSWIPYLHEINKFLKYDKDDSSTSNYIGKKGCCSFHRRDTNDDNKTINYDIKFRFPLLSCLGEEKAAIPVDYDFSTITIRALIAAIKAGKGDKLQDKDKNDAIAIKFGNSLRLLGVRDIISLMQVCSKHNIKLPDIKNIDWQQAFKNITRYEDSRLFEFTFDEEQKPLLISMYLTGFDQVVDDGDEEDSKYSILTRFVRDYNVPVNEQDNHGYTIMHHMIEKKDMKGIEALLNALQPQQRIHFDIKNDSGSTIIHYMIKEHGFDGLKSILNALKPKQFINFNIQDRDGNTIIHQIIRENLDAYDNLSDLFNFLKRRKQVINLSIPNKFGESIMYLALKKDEKQLSMDSDELDQFLDFIWKKTQKDKKLVLHIAKWLFVEEYDWESLLFDIKQSIQSNLHLFLVKICKQRQFSRILFDLIYEQYHTTPQMSDDKHKMFSDGSKTNADEKQMDTHEKLVALDINENAEVDEKQILPQMNDDEYKIFLAEWEKHIQYVSTETSYNIWHFKMRKICVQRNLSISYGQSLKEIKKTKEYDFRINLSRSKEKEIRKHYPHYRNVDEHFLDESKIAQQMKQMKEIAINENESALQPYFALQNVYGCFEGMNLIHQLLLEQNVAINTALHTQQSPLGYILINYFKLGYVKYFAVVKHFLESGGVLLSNETSTIAHLFAKTASELISEPYFAILEMVMAKCGISFQSLMDKQRNNPLHIAIMNTNHEETSAQDLREPVSYLLQILTKLCLKYPQWLQMKNTNGDVPIYLTLNANINHHTKRTTDRAAFYCLCKLMSYYYDINVMTNQRKFVLKMIKYAYNLLKYRKNIYDLDLLLHCFDYKEIFVWSQPLISKHFQSKQLKGISLIGYIVENAKAKYILEGLLNCKGMKKTDYEPEQKIVDEFLSRKWQKQVDSQYEDETRSDFIDYSVEEDDEKGGDDFVDRNMEQPNDGQANPFKQIEHSLDISAPKKQKHINWVDVVYSTTVEVFSTFDLITDIIIFYQLYQSKNTWWTSLMLLFLLSPYLVSYGALASILQRIIHHNQTKCLSFLVVLFATPFSLVYLFAIDIVFMLYAIGATLWFLFTCTKHDIRNKIDEKVFHQWFKMNTTQIVGYRRLRTLSQLFFETIPQIILQLRILWVIRWTAADMDNIFQIDEITLIWSIVLAITNLCLEAGIILFESKALKTSFLQYSLTCLSGRVQFIPYKSLIENIVTNQYYMEHAFDDNYIVDENCRGDKIYCDQNADFILDYDSISYRNYKVLYQFSTQSVHQLAQKLRNCPPMKLPSKLELSSTNIPIQNLITNVLCQARIQLGPESVGEIDISSLCDLYQSSLNKMKLNIKAINLDTAEKIIWKNTLHYSGNDKTKIADSEKFNVIKKITTNLINFGEISAIGWFSLLYDNKQHLSFDQQMEIKLDILNNCMHPKLWEDSFDGDVKEKYKTFFESTTEYEFHRLDILRNCYENKFYIGLDCRVMKVILTIIKKRYYPKCDVEESWCYVVMFILLYTTGQVFGVNCIHGCCKLDESIIELLAKKVPSIISVTTNLSNNAKFTYQLFERCKVFEGEIEQILINKCKSEISLSGMDTYREEVSLKICTNIDIKSEQLNETHTNFTYQLNQKEQLDIPDADIAFFDDIAFKLQFYHLDLKVNRYLIFDNITRDVDVQRIYKQHSGFEKKYEHDIDISEDDFKNKYPIQINEIQLIEIQLILVANIVDHRDAHIKIFFDDNKRHLLHYQDMYNEQPQPVAATNNIFKININHKNVGLKSFNYHLLHFSNHIPKITIKSTVEFSLSFEIKYTKLYCNKIEQKYHKVPDTFPNNHSLEECPSMERIVSILQTHSKLEIYNVDGSIAQEAVTELMKSFRTDDNSNLISDFLHVIKEHLDTNRLEYCKNWWFIHNKVTEKREQCGYTQCSKVERVGVLNQDRWNTLQMYRHHLKDLFYMDFMNTMHNYFIHAVDAGCIVDYNRFFGTQQTHTMVTDASEDIDFGDLCKDETIQNLVIYLDYIQSKGGRGFRMLGFIDDEDKISQKEQETGIAEFDFGSIIPASRFASKLNSLKTEIIDCLQQQKSSIRRGYGKNISVISLWDLGYISALQFAKCSVAKCMKSDTIDSYETWIKPGTSLTVNHIMAVLFYCNFTSISREVTAAFRDQKYHKSMKTMKLGHLSQLLFETVNLYGTKTKQSATAAFYCGMSRIYFSSFYSKFQCPRSTTAQLPVALKFACTASGRDGGIVIQIQNDFHSEAKFFNTSLFSCYAVEDERLFFGHSKAECNLLLSSIIFIKREPENYQHIIHALSLLDKVTKGYALTDSETPTNLDVKIIKTICNAYKSCDREDTFKNIYIKNVKNIERANENDINLLLKLNINRNTFVNMNRKEFASYVKQKTYNKIKPAISVKLYRPIMKTLKSQYNALPNLPVYVSKCFHAFVQKKKVITMNINEIMYEYSKLFQGFMHHDEKKKNCDNLLLFDEISNIFPQCEKVRSEETGLISEEYMQSMLDCLSNLNSNSRLTKIIVTTGLIHQITKTIVSKFVSKFNEKGWDIELDSLHRFTVEKKY
eukprot:3706_1